jgi:hypothetical protein
MLFLAVFLGFVAENIREHRVEAVREREYISSLARDINNDMKLIDSLNAEHNVTRLRCDTLLAQLTGTEILSDSYSAFRRWGAVAGFNEFVPNDGTIEQLKSSGALRLVKKKEVVDKMIDYYKITQLIRIHQSVMNSFFLQQANQHDLFNVPRLVSSKGRFPVPLLSTDEKGISRFYMYIMQWKGFLTILQHEYFVTAQTKAKDVLQAIEKEYHLENN